MPNPCARPVAASEAPCREASPGTEAAPSWREGLAVVAHELRNPLGAIILALQSLPRDQTAARQLAVAERQARRAVRIVGDLFDLCAGSLGKLSVCPELLDLAAVVAGAAQAVECLLVARRHRLTVTLPPKGPTVLADPLRLEQILTNLLTNAAKFTDPGGDIRLTAETKDGQVVIRVRDNGQGISPGLVQRVFEPFSQGTGPTRGLGIGLTLVRALVELHGGSVGASSDGPGKGAEFVVHLPSPQAHSPECRRPSAAADQLCRRHCPDKNCQPDR
jgi:signal transduction histidine kinase